MKTKYNIGDRVRDGKVVGIYSSDLYIHLITQSKRPVDKIDEQWSAKFPGWKNKVLYVIEVDEPTKNMTLQEVFEFVKASNLDIDNTEAIKYYEALPLNTHLTVPEDGVIPPFPFDLYISPEAVDEVMQNWDQPVSG